MPTPVTNQSTVYPLPTGSTPTTTATKNDALGKDAFLKLLVAQLKYQDPLKPTDAQSFMAQTAQFTQVEKLEEMAKQMSSSVRTSGLATASGLLGRTIKFGLPDGTTATGVVSAAIPTADGVSLRVGTRETTLDQVVEIKATA